MLPFFLIFLVTLPTIVISKATSVGVKERENEGEGDMVMACQHI